MANKLTTVRDNTIHYIAEQILNMLTVDEACRFLDTCMKPVARELIVAEIWHIKNERG